MNRVSIPVAVILLSLLSLAFSPQAGVWGDRSDNTYANPILPADFSDLDAIRVGDRYYAISSTLQYSPGMAVLEARDLVNWRIIGHVVPDLTQISPELNWNRMARAGRGIWAGAIRYHEGKFWVYFTSPDDGLFVSTAANPAGPWSPVKNIWHTAGWDDPCPFWDDDGQAYLVMTNFTQQYKIHLFKMDASGEHLLAAADRVIHQSNGSEANKVYKMNGIYYHYFSEVHAEGRVAMMERAHHLDGPWEQHQLIHVNPHVDKEPNQGGLVQVPNGRWYFVTHQGTGDWEGRAGVLQPVTWINGWPILGRVGADGIGNMVWNAPKPISGFPITDVWASDDFAHPTLRPEWEWNYQPRAGSWSLEEHPGYLRLHAFPPLRKDDFGTVGDVLTQRSMRTAHNQVTALFDLAGMTDNQRAGLAHFGRTYCTLGVWRDGASDHLVFDLNGRVARGPEIHQNRIWLRSTWDFAGISQFSYSLNGIEFEDIGATYQLTWGDYRGDRVGLFTFNNSAAQGYAGLGYVDIDSFSYSAIH
jgi:beta-xylosidase